MGCTYILCFSKQLKNREYQTSDVIRISRRHTDFIVYLWEIADALKFLSLLDETYVKLKSDCIFQFTYLQTYRNTLFESENERQKIEPVPNPLPRASRNFSDVKTRNIFFFHNWTLEIIPFICFGMQMDRT